MVYSFVGWCTLNHLQVNIGKTKELVVDVHRIRPPLTPVSIQEADVEVVRCYKYLEVHLDNRREWARNTETLYKRGQLYFLLRLGSFNVCQRMLQIFFHSMVASAIYYVAVCSGHSMKAGDADRFNKQARKASSRIGVWLDLLEAVVEKRMLTKLVGILNNISHPSIMCLLSRRASSATD